MLGDQPQTPLPVPAPFFGAEGAAAASYQPGHVFAEVQFTVHETRTTCTAAEARDLIAVLMQVLGADLDPRLAGSWPRGEERQR